MHLQCKFYILNKDVTTFSNATECSKEDEKNKKIDFNKLDAIVYLADYECAIYIHIYI